MLLVDDDEDARAMYSEGLGLAGFAVTTASDGEEALSKAINGRFDVIVLDVAMPKMDGISVIKTLRANSTTQSVPIVTLSAFSDNRTRAAVVEAGGDLALEKPCLPAELEAVVRILVQRGKRIRDRQ